MEILKRYEIIKSLNSRPMPWTLLQLDFSNNTLCDIAYFYHEHTARHVANLLNKDYAIKLEMQDEERKDPGG